jgi:hypothetical protein
MLVGKAFLIPSKHEKDLYHWECPECKSGSFSWSKKINEQWGHPPDKAFCAVCFTYHDVEFKENC